MFTGFDFGIDTADIMGQVTALVGNPLVTSIVGGTLALAVGPRLINFIKRVVGSRG